MPGGSWATAPVRRPVGVTRRRNTRWSPASNAIGWPQRSPCHRWQNVFGALDSEHGKARRCINRDVRDRATHRPCGRPAMRRRACHRREARSRVRAARFRGRPHRSSSRRPVTPGAGDSVRVKSRWRDRRRSVVRLFDRAGAERRPVAGCPPKNAFAQASRARAAPARRQSAGVWFPSRFGGDGTKLVEPQGCGGCRSSPYPVERRQDIPSGGDNDTSWLR